MVHLQALIAEATEGDYKVALEKKKPKSWLKSVSAFANGIGGTLFFGVDNEGILSAWLILNLTRRRSAV